MIKKMNAKEFIALVAQRCSVGVLAMVGLLILARGAWAMEFDHTMPTSVAHGATPADTDPFTEDGWSHVFTYPGFDGEVMTVEASGGDLYVGGDFTVAGGTQVRNVARYRAATGQWEPLGAGLDKAVLDLLVDGSTLYASAGGGVHRWDGQTWTRLGGHFDGSVNALAMFGGQLYATGWFNHLDNTLMPAIARWNGSQWETLGAGLGQDEYNTEGRTLAVMGNDLYVGGRFTTAGGQASANLARWDGSAWHPVGASGEVNTLTVDGTRLYVGGRFGLDNTTPAGVLRYENGQWQNLGAGDANVLGVATSVLPANGGLYVAGDFEMVRDAQGDTWIYNIAFWDGSRWHALGQGLTRADGSSPLKIILDVWQGKVVAGGRFDRSGQTVLTGLALWDGGSWQRAPLTPQQGRGLDRSVSDLEVAGNDLYAAGWFTLAGALQTNGLARWDGQQWTAVGTPDLGGLSAAMYVTVDPSLGIVVAGPTDPKYQMTWGVVRWTGQQWERLGNDIPGTIASLRVEAGSIYIGGAFTGFSDGNRNVARWDGSQWIFYPPLLIEAEQIEIVDGHLYACGPMLRSGFLHVPVLLLWQNDHWDVFDFQDLNPYCSLAPFGGALYLPATVREQQNPTDVNLRLLRVQGGSWHVDEIFNYDGGLLNVYGGRLFLSPDGDLFLITNLRLPEQYQDDPQQLSVFAGIGWRKAGQRRLLPVPDSDFGGKMLDIADIVRYQDALIVGGGFHEGYPQYENLLAWTPPVADLRLNLEITPAWTLLGQAATVQGRVEHVQGESAPYVAVTTTLSSNVETVQTVSTDACAVDGTSIGCYYRRLSSGEQASFTFTAVAKYVGALLLGLDAQWSGVEGTPSDNVQTVRIPVFDKLDLVPEGGRSPFWFGPDTLVDVRTPAGAVTEPLSLYVGPGIAPSPGEGRAIAPPVFSIDNAPTLRSSTPITFQAPLSVTVTYDDVGAHLVFEETLGLYRYDEQTQTWQASQLDCTDPPPVALEPDRNRVRAPVCRTGLYALLGDARPTVYLPGVFRSH